MKHYYSLVILCLLVLKLEAQEFNGYRSGNYTGVNGVFFNPANIADSRYRFDINGISIGTSAGNNQASFNVKNTINSFDADSLTNQLFGKNAGPSNGAVNVDIRSLSFMLSTGKMAFALTTRGRVMSNINDIDGKLAGQIMDDMNDDVQLPYTISSNSNMRMNVNAWSEYGLSVAGVLGQEGPHFIKGGFTFKYLAGVGNGYINIGNLQTTLNEDAVQNEVYLNNTTGKLGIGFGGVSLSDFDLDKFTYFKSSGFGGDLGFVYEYRPDHDGASAKRKDLNKYKFKVGAALLDLGSIKYEKDQQRSGAYNIDITGSERLNTSELEDVELDDYKSFFESRPQFFMADNSNTATNYAVSLPTTLQVELDYHFSKGFYLNLASQLPMTNSKTKIYNSHFHKAITVTPRFEGRALGLYIPVNYNELTQLNAGIGLRLGPLFVGSSSVITAVLDNSKQADFYFGLRFGGLYKNEHKRAQKKEKKLQEEYRKKQGRE
jgi:hypothetical protein